MTFFRTLFAIDALAFLVVLFFFVEGLGDGSVSSFNIAMWLPLVGVPAAVLVGGLYLHSIGRTGAAKALLGALAVPVLLIGSFFALMILMAATNPGAFR